MISRLATMATKDFACKKDTFKPNTVCIHANLNNTFNTCKVMKLKLVVLLF